VQPSPAAAATLPAPVATETPAAGNPDSTTPVNLTSLITARGEALEVDPDDAEKNKIFGILAYLVFFVPLLAAKDSPYAKYHANQGLVLFLVWISLAIVLWVIGKIFDILPSELSILFAILNLAYIAPFILLILGVINAAAGKCVPLPFIGGVKLLK
jgi:uncharacterized membrane protein